MDELVEKVARAIDSTPHGDWNPQRYAQAALAAIRETHAIVPKEPTEAMLDASWNLGDWSDVLEQAKRHEANCEAYKAMIEAASPQSPPANPSGYSAGGQVSK